MFMIQSKSLLGFGDIEHTGVAERPGRKNRDTRTGVKKADDDM